MPTYCAASDQALLISLAHAEVLPLLRAFQAARISGIENLHPAFDTLLVRFDSLRLSHAGIEEAAESLLQAASPQPPTASPIEIPVCYSGAYGPDLAEVAAQLQLAPETVIQLHSTTLYTVYFLGFVPGFAYLGDLPAQLTVPRLATPRTQVPPGSVAIANRQTAVYPLPTPGGWRLIGRTPLQLFDPTRETMSLLEIGQRVRFTPIAETEYRNYSSR